MRDERFGLVPLDREKHDAFQRMREDSSFDLVIGNPPYVFETGIASSSSACAAYPPGARTTAARATTSTTSFNSRPRRSRTAAGCASSPLRRG